MIEFGWSLLYISHCTLFNDESLVYVHIKYIWCAGIKSQRMIYR